MVKKEAEEFYEDKHTIRDGRVLLYRRRGNKNKIWQCRVKLVGKTGYVTKSTGVRNYEEAVEFAGELFDELRQRVKDKRPLKSLAFYDVYQKWLGILHITTERRYYHEKTGNRYFRQFFGKYDVEDITDNVIDGYWPWRMSYWKDGPGRKERHKYPNVAETPSQATIRMERSTLKQFFGWCHRNGYMPILPAIKAIRVGRENPREHFTNEEMLKLTTYMRDVWIKGGKHELHRWQRNMIRSLIQFLLATGLRPKEFRLLRWKDVWTETGKDGVTRPFIRVREDTKTGARIVVAQPRAFKVVSRIRSMSEHTEPEDLVFCDRIGKEVKFAGKTFKALLVEVGMLAGAWA